MYGEVSKNIINPVYADFFRSTKREQHLMGSGGSGKSYVAAQKIVFKYLMSFKSKDEWYNAMLTKYPKHELDMLIRSGRIKPTNIRPYKEKIVLLRSQQNLVKDSQFTEIKNIILKYNLAVDISESGRMKAANGNEIISAGLRNGGAERLKSISGVTRFWVEEATDSGIKMSDINQLHTRMRSKYCPDPCIIMTYNPVHLDHWINRLYWLYKDPLKDESLPIQAIEDIEKTVFKKRTTYKDNPFLPQHYIDKLEATQYTDPNYYRIYALGEWGGSVEGCIYTKWTDKVKAFPDACDKFVYGVDKGMNHPYAIVKCAYLPIDIYKTEIIDGKETQVLVAGKGAYVQELVYERGLTTNEILAKYERVLPKDATYYISPEAASDRKDFRTAGYSCINANNDVANGISFLQNMNIYIVDSPTGATNIKSEIMTYKYLLNKQTNNYTDIPKKENDDAMDAIRYGIYTGFKATRQAIMEMIL